MAKVATTAATTNKSKERIKIGFDSRLYPDCLYFFLGRVIAL